MQRFKKMKMTGKTPLSWCRSLTLALGIACVATSGTMAAGTLEEITASGVIRLAGPTFPPYINATPDGTYSGIDVDIVKGFADSIGIKFEVVPSTWGTAIAGISAGKWDVAPVFCKKAEREKVVTFLEPHYQGGGVAVVLADNPLSTLEALNDPAITFVYPAGTWKEKHVDKYYPSAKVKALTSGSTAQVVLEIISGRGEATVVDAPIDITKIEAAYPGKFKFLPSKSEFLKDTNCVGSLIITKDAPELEKAMSDYIRGLKSKGGVQALYDKHIQAVLDAGK